MSDPPPQRQVRARHDDETLVVYQAYNPAIADAAVGAGTFVSPFRRERMTWIKPSFLWMAYRSGWGTKPGQTRVLRIHLTRTGFEWALAHSTLSHYDPEHDASEQSWRDTLAASPPSASSGTRSRPSPSLPNPRSAPSRSASRPKPSATT